METEEVQVVDWISERANSLARLVAVGDEIRDEGLKNLVRQMGRKVVDSIIMPSKADVLKLAVDNTQDEEDGDAEE